MPATGRRCVSRGYAWGHKGDGGLPLQGACHPGGTWTPQVLADRRADAEHAEKGGRPRSSSGGLPGVMTPVRRLQGRVEVCHWARRQGHSKERDSVCSAWTQETPRGEPKMDTWEQTEATGREQAVTALWAWLCT